MDRPLFSLTCVHADGLLKLVQNNSYQTLAATEISHIKFESYVRHEEAEISFKVPITGLTGVNGKTSVPYFHTFIDVLDGN